MAPSCIRGSGLPGLDGYILGQEKVRRTGAPSAICGARCRRRQSQKGDMCTRQVAFQRSEGWISAKDLSSWRHTHGETLGLGGEGVLCPLRGETMLSWNPVTWQPKPPVGRWPPRGKADDTGKTGSEWVRGGYRRYT